MLSLCGLIVLPVVTAVLLLVPVRLTTRHWISVFVAAIHLVLTALAFNGVLYEWPVLAAKGFACGQLSCRFGGAAWLAFDPLARLFLLVLSLVYFAVVMVSRDFLVSRGASRAHSSRRIYYSLLNVYLTASSAAMLSNHFGLYWVAAEITTLSLAPLVFFYRTQEALEAMWKFLFLASIGISFAFVGILFYALSTAGSPIQGLFVDEFSHNAGLLSPLWLKVGFIFLLSGLSVKIGFAPMQAGDVDATSNAPAPIAALMSGSLRVTGLMGILRAMQVQNAAGLGEGARILLVAAGLISIATAVLFIFRTGNFKRAISFSSVEHMGIIALALGVGAVTGALLHIFYNALAKPSLFLLAGNIHRASRTRNLFQINNVLYTMRYTGWLFLFSVFAVTGLPPFGVFFSELRIFTSMAGSGRHALLAVFLVLLMGGFIALGRSLLRMLMPGGKTTGGVTPDNPLTAEKFNASHLGALALLTILTVTGLFVPPQMAVVIREAEAILTGSYPWNP